MRGALAAFALVFAGPALAETAVPEPTEAPPEDFAGSDYVDGAGCAFVRVGVGDSVIWAPRFTAEGQHQCGLAPSFAPSVAPAEPAAPVAAAAAPRQARGFDAPGVYVQAGAFGQPANAERVKAAFTAQGWPVQTRSAGRLTLIYAGPFTDPAQAEAVLRQVRRDGMPDAFLLRQD